MLSISRGPGRARRTGRFQQHGRESACTSSRRCGRQSGAVRTVCAADAHAEVAERADLAEAVERTMAVTSSVLQDFLDARVRAAAGAVRRRGAALGRPRGRRRGQAHAPTARGRGLPRAGRATDARGDRPRRRRDRGAARRDARARRPARPRRGAPRAAQRRRSRTRPPGRPRAPRADRVRPGARRRPAGGRPGHRVGVRAGGERARRTAPPSCGWSGCWPRASRRPSSASCST